MAGTKAFAIKRALIAQSKLWPGFAELEAEDSIWDSAYSGTQRPRQVLWFGEILWTSDRAVTFGKPLTSREEEFNIRVGIEINDYDTIQEDADTKAETLMQELEEMVSDYRIFGVEGIVTVGIVPIGLGEGPGNADGSRAAFLALQVNVRARK